MSNSAKLRTGFVVALALGLGSGGGCGGDPYCGDGQVDPELGETCDDGNNNDNDFCLNSCRPRPIPTLTVKWAFNADEDLGFSGDSCTDMGVREVAVEIDGASSDSGTESCSFRQVQFSDIASGSYDVTIEPQDANGTLLTSTPITTTIDFQGGDQEVEVIVPYDSWTRSYSGNFFFRVTYGGGDCSSSLVDTQRLTLTRDGQSVATATKNDDSLLGADSPCYPATESEPQTVLDVPFGPATLVVQGLDSLDAVVYETTFDTFIGAGLNNPELVFDVDAL